MFIKIGTMLINLNKIDSIKKDTNVSDFDDLNYDYIVINYTSNNQTLLTDTDEYYPQALAAYEFLCEGAMTFDTDYGKRALGLADSTGAGSDVSVRSRLEHYLSHSLDVKKQDLFRDLQDIDADLLTNTLFDLKREGKIVFDTSGINIIYHWNTATPQADFEETPYFENPEMLDDYTGHDYAEPPQAATVPTGEYHTGYDMDGSIVLLDGQKRILMSEPDYETEIMERVAILLNDATASLREQNARLQEEVQYALKRHGDDMQRIAELERELEVSRLARQAIEKAVNQALGKIQHARDLQFEQKYAAADSAMKNAEVYLIGFATVDE